MEYNDPQMLQVPQDLRALDLCIQNKMEVGDIPHMSGDTLLHQEYKTLERMRFAADYNPPDVP